MKNAGGRWNKAAKSHVFEGDAQETIRRILEAGVSKDMKKALQAFYTPPGLAAEIVESAGVSGKRVLEPSAGRGALALACKAADAKEVVCVEIERKTAQQLHILGFEVHHCDFLTMTTESLRDFDRVVMNPPFARGQALKHIAHALTFLRPKGHLVSVIPGHPTDKEREKLRQMFNAVREARAIQFMPLPDDSFAESGTRVKTSLIGITL